VFASDPPPPMVAPQQADNQSDVIEIVGTRLNQTLKIDRRTYQVRQTPNSAQKDAYQLLRGVPAVTISPDDRIMLLGAPNVTVQIDGRATHTDLHNLRGGDIESIEVITNPSAQYSAEGTGGIVNIVLRKKQAEGVSGTASAEGSTLGRLDANGSVKVKRGKWTYQLETAGTVGRGSRSTYHKLRTVEQIQDGPETINSEDGEASTRDASGMVHGKLTYEIDARTSIVAEAYGGGSRDISQIDREFRGLTPDFASFSEHQRVTNTAPFYAFVAALDHKGKKDGETLKASAQVFGNPEEHARTEATFDNGDSFSIDRRNRLVFAEAQADWEHPLGKNRILSMGAHWNYDYAKRRYGFVSNGSAVSLGPDTADEFTGSRRIIAAYATFQQPVGSWTIMPGLRIERGSWHISSPGLPDQRRSSTDLFPTLHVEHALTKSLQLTLSYSKRIDRAGLDSLQPYPIVEDALEIRRGNPDLRDQSTDSYEINLHYHRKSLDAGLILYDREIGRVWSNAYSVDAQGINVVMPINAGHQSDRGAEFDISTPVLRRVKLSASLNLFDSRVPVDLGTGTGKQETFRYTTNATLEWDGPQRGKRPGDIAQVQISTESPSRDFQFQRNARHWISWSYTRSFAPTLSITATAQNPLTPIHDRHQLLAPLVQEDYEQRQPPEFKIKLLKTFGKN
jgi:outer membrane receptor for ferrienterochelin and colicin